MELGICTDDVGDFYDVFIRPWIRTFIMLAVRRGLIMELHGQNCLFAIPSGSRKPYVVLRDLGDVFVDLETRRARSLHENFPSYKLLDAEGQLVLAQRRSFEYDHKLSNYLVLPLIEAWAIAASRHTADVLSEVRSLALKDWSALDVDPARFFGSGRDWYKYDSDSPKVGRHAYVQGDGPPLLR